MKQGFASISFALSLGVAVPAAAPEFEVAESEITRLARKELASLPEYGVFDLLTIQVDERGLVTLGGFVCRASLRGGAERAVRRIDGVTEVQNKVEILPVSIFDDGLREEIYRAIYRDSYLSRYGTPDSESLASRPRPDRWGPGYRRQDPLRPPISSGRGFPATEPLGAYAIHIIVRNGNVLLAGVVDRRADKDAAEIKANGVFGVRKVENQLQVAPASR